MEQIASAMFFHAAEQLSGALVAAYGEADPVGRARFEKLRHTLRHDRQGAAKVIRALIHLRERFPRRKKIAAVLGYFRENRHRMNYATVAARGLPIGSGVVEAACKTLVTQRMKRSGMRWRHDGGQAILTLRGLIQSDRFDCCFARPSCAMSRYPTTSSRCAPRHGRERQDESYTETFGPTT
ncbi:MAG: hypothetical protein GIW94_09485 [Candidatus Eremiobacteraeota bacterium]|nr:hypothetical protein [Candidatus Eremiobacteraeota bacterium]